MPCVLLSNSQDPTTDPRAARENQDTACLNFALSWLLYLRQAHNLPSVSSLRSLAALAGEGGSEQDELAFLKTKAKDGKHWNLVSSTLLEEAKLELRNVSLKFSSCSQKIKPQWTRANRFLALKTGVSPKALEHVLQSAHLNVQHASYSLMPAVTIFQGSIYDRLGMCFSQSMISSATYNSFHPTKTRYARMDIKTDRQHRAVTHGLPPLLQHRCRIRQRMLSR